LKTLLGTAAIIICLSSCRKTAIAPENLCTEQTANPASNSFFSEDVASINYSGNHCGMMPVNKQSFWVYEDSLFDNSGNFLSRRFDTLRYTKTYQTPDNLIWWEGNKEVGLPEKMYSSQTAIYGLETRMFMVDTMQSKKEFYFIEKDSVKYLTSFGDIMAFAKLERKTDMINSPAGNFHNYIFYEKYSPSYRRDRIYFVPGMGVIKYTNEYYKAPGSPANLTMNLISTLVSYHVN
jgi:hypothetical protein